MEFTIEGATYSYDIIGHGPPVLLLHGFTGSKESLVSLRESLLPDYQVIRLDLPGHGKTFSKAISMEVFSDHLAEFLQYIKVEQAHFIGYSMGGRVALSFANLYPEKVRSLTLESSSPGLRTKEERKERRKKDEKLARRLTDEGLEAFVRFWENIPLFQSQKDLPKEVQGKLRRERLSQRADHLADSLISMGTGTQPSWWESLNELAMPIHLIVGELDEKFVRINEEMALHIRDLTLSVIKGVGHAPHLEGRKMFEQVVRNFLDKIEEDI